MKAERRHELQHNVLADQLAAWIEYSRQYAQAIIASVVGVVVLLGVYFYFANRSAAQASAAWSRYVAASESAMLRRGSLQPLIDVANEYASTSGGQWARLTAAEMQFEQGVMRAFDNRVQSNEFLNSADQNFSRVLADASDPTLRARATMGLGRTHEAQNRLEQARLEYDAMITLYPDDVYVAEARQRRADLDRDSTKSFYDWFAKQEPSSTEADAAIPGHKPKFEMNALPAEGPIFERLGGSTSSKTEAPKNEPAKGEEPTTEPATEPPKTEALKTEPSTTEAPKVESKTEAPATNPPPAAETKSTESTPLPTDATKPSGKE
ncbi:MAG TPA: hypothetical protein VHZ24_19555 [Pirellulales bacterium]|jgi:predicted negative regulator of RcsB-dependent stress response|nr:hypothetical protein [Pirellulales bacterium]